MHIQHIQLKNFRGFESIELELDPHLTVLVGKNGMGKTTALEAIAVAVGSLFLSLDAVPSIGIKKSDAYEKCIAFGSSLTVQKQFPVVIEANGAIDSTPLHWIRALNGENGRTTVSDAREITEISKKYRECIQQGDQTLILPVIAYYGTGRLWDQHREKRGDALKKNARTNGYIDALDGRSNIKQMLNWFWKMNYNEQRFHKTIPEYAVVKGAMCDFFARLEKVDDVDIQFNPDNSEIEISYKDASQQPVFRTMSQLSDGYRCALCLIADIAYRMAVLNAQLLNDIIQQTPGIVLIDEIDLHLHPAWQQRILGDLRAIFPQVQFIVTTHAPAVISSVHTQNIRMLNHFCVEQPGIETLGRDANSVLRTVMNVRERPEAIVEQFDNFYHAMDLGDYQKAEALLRALESVFSDDAEVTSMRIQLDLEKE